MDEVIVKADTTGWQYNLKLFRDRFIGKMKGSDDCKIINSRDLHFYYDSKANELVAHAKIPLIIENATLGYRIKYWLEEFNANFKAKTTYYFGYPQFEKMLPKNKRQARQWQKNRLEAYQGSLMELVRGIHAGNDLDSMGWEVRKLHYEENPARPDDEFLNAKINEHWDNSDSLNYFMALMKKPRQIAVVSPRLFDFKQFLDDNANGARQFHYKGYLHIVYLKEHQDRAFYSFRQPYRKEPQNSIIQMTLPPYQLYPNGLMNDTRNYLLSGYLGWYEKLTTQLPMDYTPIEE